MRLVVRGVRGKRLEVEELHRRDRPLRLGERHLEVEQGRVVVRVGRLLLEGHGHPGRLRLLSQQRRRLDEAGEDLRRLQQHLQIRLPGLLQQRLGLLDVLLTLRDVVVVPLKALADQVVAEAAVAVQRAINQSLTVGDQLDREPHVVVVERGLGGVHVEHHGLRRLARQHGDIAGRLVGLRLRGRQLGHRVDVAREQRVQARGRVVDRGDLQLIDVRLAADPVVGILLEQALLAGRERAGHERAGADGVLEVGFAVLEDPGVVVGEVGGQVGVGSRQRDHHGQLVDLLQALEIDAGDERHREAGRLRHLLDRVDDVVGAERFAVVEGDVRAQLDLVGGCIAVGVPLQREPGAGGKVGVDQHQRVVDVLDPALVDGRDADQRIQRLGRAATDEPGPQPAAPDRCPGRASGGAG